MKTILKYAAAVAVTGALALAAATPGQARDGRNTAAAIGFGAGALVGAAAVSANNNYYGGPGYYDRGYAYGPAYEDRAYVYERPAPAYVYERRAPAYAYDPAPRYSASEAYAYSPGRCWVSTDNTRNYGYYGSCASTTKDIDAGLQGTSRRNVRAVR
jgi:hypothetical protein